MTSVLSDRGIKKFKTGSIVLENLVFVGWVMIKKNYKWDNLHVRNKPITKLKILCDIDNVWKYQDVLKLFHNDMIGDRQHSKSLNVFPRVLVLRNNK